MRWPSRSISSGGRAATGGTLSVSAGLPSRPVVSRGTRGEAGHLIELGVIHRHQGRWAEAEDDLREALRLSAESGSPAGQGQALRHLGNLFRYLRRWAEAEAACQRGRDLSRDAGDPAGEARALNYLGNAFRSQKRWQEAETHYH